MTRKLLDSAWRSYAERVMPVSAPAVQHQECRRAFYAGAQALFGGMLTNLEPGLEETEADLQLMDGIQAELEEFVRDLTEGRA